MICHGAGLGSGRLRRAGGRSQGIETSFPSLVPDAPLPEERASLAHNARASRGGACAPARARRRGRALRPMPPVGVGDRSRSFMPPPSAPGAGRGVPVSRELRAGLRARAGGRTAAARFARVIARVRAGRPEGALLPPAHAGGFAAPSHCFLQKSGTAAPEAALLSCLFYTIPRKVKPFLEQKLKISDKFLTAR